MPEHSSHRKTPDASARESRSGSSRVQSLSARRSPLASPAAQVSLLESVSAGPDAARNSQSFRARLAESGWPELRAGVLEVLQLNLGRLCNMTCAHCHVDAGPDRVTENMDRATVDACLSALDRTPAHTVDLTGGAPELNPNFEYLVDQCVARRKHVIDRCNLTVLLLPRFRHLPTWLGERGVEIVCSLPHYGKSSTDAQRGAGTHEKSIRALRLLNEAGYGRGDERRQLNLMVNPAGAWLAGNQKSMERDWHDALERNHGVFFDGLVALNNMPIARFLEWLIVSRNLATYMRLLRDRFNSATIPGLMCRNTLSVSWDGTLHDCDFNQMLDLEASPTSGPRQTIFDMDPEALAGRQIVTGSHCFGCTAGAGSSCGGSIA